MVVSPRATKPQFVRFADEIELFPIVIRLLARTTVMGFLNPTSWVFAMVICDSPRLSDLGLAT
jgi:hypothetical protein